MIRKRAKSSAEEAAEAPAPPSPGLLCRQARIAAGWQPAEVARALYLSATQLRALEEDDYANLPSETYILGYWKNYADLLGISLDESIAAHKHNLHRPTPRAVRRKPIFTEPGGRVLVGLFALLAAGFLFGIWYWQSQSQSPLSLWHDWRVGNIHAQSDAANGAADDAPAAIPAQPPALVEDGFALPEPSFAEPAEAAEVASLPPVEITDATEAAERTGDAAAAATADDAEEEAVAQGAAAEESAAAESAAAEDAGADATADEAVAESADAVADAAQPPAEAEPTAEAAPAAEAQPAAEAETAAAEAPAAAEGRGEIILVLNEASWLSVVDNDNKQLVRRRVDGGQRLTLAGQPPFQVVVGNAAGVEVEYRGRAVQFESRDGVGRFSVGE